MALILILGHALALTPFFNRIISTFTKYCDNTASAALWVSLLTISVSLINWGLCLVFGAIFARKVAEKAKAKAKVKRKAKSKAKPKTPTAAAAKSLKKAK